MANRNRSTRFMLTPRDSALKLGQVTGMVVFNLPVGFHFLPRDEQKRIVQEQMSEGLAVAEAMIDRDCTPVEVVRRDHQRFSADTRAEPPSDRLRPVYAKG